MRKISWLNARALWNRGLSFTMVPSNGRIEVMGCIVIPTKCDRWKEHMYGDLNKAFKLLCNEFSYYNCNDECGNTIHFYV